MTEPEYRRVDFEVINEDWNRYRLPNGVIIKFKTVVQEIFEHVGTRDSLTGLPNYTTRSSNVVSVIKEEADE